MHIEVTRLDIGSIKPLWLKERAEQDIIVPPEARITAPITILKLHGSLDGSSYESLIAEAQEQIGGGAGRMIIDLETVSALSSAGIVGIYTVGSLLEGESLEDLEGYAITSMLRNDLDDGKSFSNLLLAGASDDIAPALESTGIDRVALSFPSLDEAISSFPE